MQWSNVKWIFLREIRDQLRDRRTMFAIFVLPVLMYPLMGMVILKITHSSKSGNRCFDSVEDRALGIPARIVSRPGIGIPGIGAAAERRRGLGFNIARLRVAVAANP